MATKEKPAKKRGKRSTDPETLGKQLDHYEEVFDEVEHFVRLIAQQEEEISDVHAAELRAKEKYDRLRNERREAEEARDGTKHALFMFLKPGPAGILSFAERMEPADEEKHGTNAEQWREEPISALRCSPDATRILMSADVLFVGQLQDRVQAEPAKWFEKFEGLTAPMAAAVADKLSDFIEEHSGK